MNKCLFTGTVASEPKLEYTMEGNKVCKFTLEIGNASPEIKDGWERFVYVTAHDNKAEFAAKYLHKGTKVALAASAKSRRVDINGKAYLFTDFHADKIELAQPPVPANN